MKAKKKGGIETMQNKKLRAPCVPLITNDPMFNVWSFADQLTDDVPRHWTGARQFITGSIAVDGTVYQFIGKIQPDNLRYVTEYPALPHQGHDHRLHL